MKIGHTKKAVPEDRAKELSSSTSIPLPFVVEASWLVEYPSRWEATMHRHFAPHRISKDREFFRLEVSEAEAKINRLIYGTDDLLEASMRGMETLLDLYRRFPASFTTADSSLILKVENFIEATRGDSSAGK